MTLPRRKPGMPDDGLDDLDDRDLRDLAIEYELLPDPQSGYMPYLQPNTHQLPRGDREWILQRLRAIGAESPWARQAREMSFSDNDIVSVDRHGRITTVRDFSGNGHASQ